MGDGEAFGLVQGFAGDHGDLRAILTGDVIPDQFGHRIGGLAFQTGGNLGLAAGLIGAGRGDVQILDLGIGDHKLGREALRGKRFGLGLQRGEGGGKVIDIEGGVADFGPAAFCAVQQRDAVIGEVQGEVRLHGAGLAQLPGGRECKAAAEQLPTAGFCRREGDYTLS